MGGVESKVVVWLHGEVQTPPFSTQARREAGFLLRLLQEGGTLQMPHSRTMPSIGDRCHELRINDHGVTWRIVYRIDDDAVLILEVFKKKTKATPKAVIKACQTRLEAYEKAVKDS